MAEQPAAEQPAFDCAGALADVSNQHPLRFDFNHDGLRPAMQPNLEPYAKLLSDPRCGTGKITIVGYADRWGSANYNQKLSEDRAAHIARELSRLGVDSSRLLTMGMSETRPLLPDDNLEAWRANRRVEITFSE